MPTVTNGVSTQMLAALNQGAEVGNLLLAGIGLGVCMLVLFETIITQQAVSDKYKARASARVVAAWLRLVAQVCLVAYILILVHLPNATQHNANLPYIVVGKFFLGGAMLCIILASAHSWWMRGKIGDPR